MGTGIVEEKGYLTFATHEFFRINRHQSDKLHSECRECERLSYKEYRKRTGRAKDYAQQKQRRLEKRALINQPIKL